MPADAPGGLDTPLPDPPPIMWDSLGNLVPVNPPPHPPDMAEQKETEESDGEASTSSVNSVEKDVAVLELDCTWHDVALSIAAEFMKKMKQEVKDKLGYTTTAVRQPFCRRLPLI